MGFILFLAVTVLGGLLFIINGANVLLSDCAAVTFDNSQRITGRSFLIQATCLNEFQANPSDIPGWMGGWGMILLGLISMSAFIWMIPILAFLDRRKLRRAQAALERRQSPSLQRANPNRGSSFGVMTSQDVAMVARKASADIAEFRRGFQRRVAEVGGPNIRAQDALDICRELLPKPSSEESFTLAWIYLGHASNMAGVAHEALWLNVRNSSVLRVNRQDTLDRIALAWRGKSEPPYSYMTNREGAFISPFSDLASAG